MKYIFLMLSLFGTMVVGVKAGKMYTPIGRNNKVACIAEHLKKGNTHYIFGPYGQVICIPGWENEEQMCEQPVCNFAGKTCDHGNCTEPHVCTCELGWTGQACDECVCMPGCKNGYCNEPFECICHEGWQGLRCDKPQCGECEHGFCSAPGVCTCHPGYIGDKCQFCQASPDCKNGYCHETAFQCKCYPGWTGYYCDQPICHEGCHPDRGTCMRPDECWCKPGWQGVNCSECVPYWNCVHGTCQNPWECICEDGFKGKDCNATQDIDGNWGEWSAWSDCSCKGKQTRERRCDDPKPEGDGAYCKHNFSETESYFRKCDEIPLECNITTTMPPPDPIDGGYTQWTEFSPCTAICVGDDGMRRRRRFCTNPEPQDGGRTCEEQGLGPDFEDMDCVGITPLQTDDPSEICFAIGG